MSTCPFHWVNIFLPASAWSQSVGSSLQERALSDLVRFYNGPATGGLAWARSPFQQPQGKLLSLYLLSLRKWAGPVAQQPQRDVIALTPHSH